MPVVPFSRVEPRIDDSLMPSDTHLAMAAATIAQEQGVLRDFRNPDEPSVNKKMKDFIEKARTREEDPNVTKSTERTVKPGERAIDRDYGMQSPREVYRTEQ